MTSDFSYNEMQHELGTINISPAFLEEIEDFQVDDGLREAILSDIADMARHERPNANYFVSIKVDILARTMLHTLGALSYRNASFGTKDGYAWMGTRARNKKGEFEFTPDTSRKLRIASEQDMFTLLGLPFIEPKDRSEQMYRKLMVARGHSFGDPAPFLIAAPAVNRSLFDADDTTTSDEQLEAPASGRLNDIDLSSVPMYDPRCNNSYALELDVLRNALEARDDLVAPSEEEVIDFAARRYNHWLRCELQVVA